MVLGLAGTHADYGRREEGIRPRLLFRSRPLVCEAEWWVKRIEPTRGANHREIAEIEVNPLLATPGGAIGLAARVVLTEP